MKKIFYTASFFGALALNSQSLLADTSKMFKPIDKVCPRHEVVKEFQRDFEESKQTHTFPDELTWTVTMEPNTDLVDKLVKDQSRINLTNDMIRIVCVYGTEKEIEPVTLEFKLGMPSN